DRLEGRIYLLGALAVARKDGIPVDGGRAAGRSRTEGVHADKQMLYGQRAELVRVVATGKDSAGRVTAAFAEIELKESRGSDYTKPFVFPAINRPLADGALYTLDPCPNDWYGYWCAQVVS